MGYPILKENHSFFFIEEIVFKCLMVSEDMRVPLKFSRRIKLLVRKFSKICHFVMFSGFWDARNELVLL